MRSLSGGSTRLFSPCLIPPPPFPFCVGWRGSADSCKNILPPAVKTRRMEWLRVLNHSQGDVYFSINTLTITESVLPLFLQSLHMWRKRHWGFGSYRESGLPRGLPSKHQMCVENHSKTFSVPPPFYSPSTACSDNDEHEHNQVSGRIVRHYCQTRTTVEL